MMTLRASWRKSWKYDQNMLYSNFPKFVANPQNKVLFLKNHSFILSDTIFLRNNRVYYKIEGIVS